MEISKPTASRPGRAPARAAESELDELMAILGDASDADEPPVDDADLAQLLEGLGASAKEREEAEVRQLLEGLPELHEEAESAAIRGAAAAETVASVSSPVLPPAAVSSPVLPSPVLPSPGLVEAETVAPEDLEEVEDPDQMTIEAFEASEEELRDTENAVQQQGAGNLSLPIKHRAVPNHKATPKPKLPHEVKSHLDGLPPLAPELFGPDDPPPIPIEELEEPEPSPDLKEVLAALSEPLPDEVDEGEAISLTGLAVVETAPEESQQLQLSVAPLPEPEPESVEPAPSNTPVSLRELLPLPVEPPPAKPEPPPTRLRELPIEPELGLPPMRDPLAARRALAGERLEQFLKEDVQTLLAFRILRFYVASGMERLTLDELQEELVDGRDVLAKTLTHLITAGLMLLEGSHYVLNTRARKLSLLGTAVAQWQTPRRREQLLSWLKSA
ncbi:MAG: hypothetical protein ACKO6N_26755 [Myxococcota bacterium]